MILLDGSLNRACMDTENDGVARKSGMKLKTKFAFWTPSAICSRKLPK